jgi:hypothetical protein
MANFLDNDDNIIKEELLTYYHFRANLLTHLKSRLKVLTFNGSEYDYCTVEGQIKEINNLLEFVRAEGRHTTISKLTESNEIKLKNKTNTH